MTDTPTPQTLNLTGAGIDARQAAEDQAEAERHAMLAASDAGSQSESDYRDDQWATLDRNADFLACDAPLTVCAALHDHRDVGDLRTGGVWRGATHDHANLGGAAPQLVAHITDVHAHGVMDDSTPTELAEQHAALHAIEDDARQAFRSPASLGAVLAGIIHGDWQAALEDLANDAATRMAEGDPEPITALLWAVEKARKALHDAEDQVKAAISQAMRHDLHTKLLPVEGFGTLEAKAGAKRKDWDVDRAMSSVQSVGMTQAGIVDPETGELDADRARDYQQGAADVLAACTPSMRVGGLAAFGLDADDYCTTEYGRATVIARWADGL